MYNLVKDSGMYFQCNIYGKISKQKINLIPERERP